ncbi:SnoaL-like domain-containing protein [Pelagibius litoralis]|uniref:SnoaL-like domain-containing protein n=1 Tax=Pelagibius litoralis TaxID=374515 RepID=A0A967F2W4_9PROT|nr:nuclear transport factor 2 family protein [Pelagibius litoralis]NIA72095.1 SnoaL-like domain-containing protein [Pelagibius litoralis]
MTDTPNIHAVKGFLEAQYAGDFDKAFAEFAQPDFQWIVSTGENEDLRGSIPWAGYVHKGKEGYVRLTSLLFSEFEALEFNSARFTDAADRVFVEGRFVFRHRETAKIAVSDFLARFDMCDGRITGGQFYENTAGVADARKAT